MWYLITKLAWFLIIAFIIGLYVGWTTTTPRKRVR